MPTLPYNLCASVGIEMEFNLNHGATDRRLARLGHRAHDWFNRPGCVAVSQPKFVNYKVKRDWVIHNEHTGVEFSQRKPSVRGLALERKIEALCNQVRDSEGAIGGVRECGVHVHICVPHSLRAPSGQGVSYSHLHPEYAQFLVGHERFFMYCVPRTRQFGYNPPYLSSTSSAITGRNCTNAAATATELARTNPGNVLRIRQWCHALSEFGTIEFRLLEGTESAERVINWIALIEFVHRQAIEGHLPANLLYEDTDSKLVVLEKMHAFFNFPQHIHNWLTEQYNNANH